MSNKSKGHLRRLEIEVHREPATKGGGPGKVTGHTVHHYMEPSAASSKSGAFMEHGHHSQPFSKNEHEAMLDHVLEHLGGEGESKDEAEEG
jgi:hypothetical protein